MDGMDDEIQLTLPSNSSIGFFPDNKPGLYHTKLSSTLNLEGDWEAALMEIQYPHNWRNLEKDMYIGMILVPSHNDNAKIEALKKLCRLQTSVYSPKYFSGEDLLEINESQLMKIKHACSTIIRIPAGYFGSTLEFIERLNLAIMETFISIPEPASSVDKEFSLTFQYDRFTKLVHRRMDNISGLQFYSKSPIFQAALGLRPVGDTGTDSNFFMSPTIPYRRSRLDTTTTLFIYSDIIKYQYVGDTQAPLMGVCPVTGRDGDQCHYVFNPPFYIPLNTQSIPTIEVKVMDDYGDIIPFEPTGKVLCRIILRRRPRRW